MHREHHQLLDESDASPLQARERVLRGLVDPVRALVCRQRAADRGREFLLRFWKSPNM